MPAVCTPRSGIHPEPGRLPSSLRGKGLHLGPLGSLLVQPGPALQRISLQSDEPGSVTSSQFLNFSQPQFHHPGMRVIEMPSSEHPCGQ